MKIKDYIIIAILVIAVNYFFSLKEAGEIETVINNKYIVSTKDSIIKNYDKRKDTISIKVDSLPYDSSYYFLYDFLHERTDGTGYVIPIHR